jgi:thioredoxin reductase (NADPH)
MFKACGSKRQWWKRLKWLGGSPILYDCVIVGGGIAGLQAAIQLGRYCHKIIIIDAEDGRSNLSVGYNNIIGWPDGIAGPSLRSSGKEQAMRLGVQYESGEVVKAEREVDVFLLTTSDGRQIRARRLLLATGVKDRLPYFPELIPCMGLSVYICPDCDGYEVLNRRTLVIGSGNTGGHMALTLTHWTRDLVYINHEQTVVDEEVRNQLRDQGIEYYEQTISSIVTEGAAFKGVVLEQDTALYSEKCFIALGGNKVRSDLAEQLGVKRLNNRHIVVDARTKMTNVAHVWAAGDVSAHSEMVTIAMGDGTQAAVWIHKSLIGEDVVH